MTVYVAVVATIDAILWGVIARYLWPLITHPVVQALLNGGDVVAAAMKNSKTPTVPTTTGSALPEIVVMSEVGA